jgi:hypothetical protein
VVEECRGRGSGSKECGGERRLGLMLLFTRFADLTVTVENEVTENMMSMLP